MMSNHHILIDAWCRSLLMNDFFEIYTALGEGREAQLPVPPRYRDYIGWLQRQSLARHASGGSRTCRFRTHHADPERPAVPARTRRRAAAWWSATATPAST
jgi:hypothetical protein